MVIQFVCRYCGLLILRLHPTPMSPRPQTRPRPCWQLGATLTLPLLANFFLSNPPPNSLFIPSMSIYFLFNSSLSNSAAILLSGLANVVTGSLTPGPTCVGSGQLYGAGQMPHLIPATHGITASSTRLHAGE